MISKWKRLQWGALVGIIIALFASCPGAGSGGGGGGGAIVPTVDVPDNIVGTIALTNGTSAVLDLQTAAVEGAVANTVMASAAFGLTGTVRYEKEDYFVTGVFDNETAELQLVAENSGGQKFEVGGTYSSSAGFSGVVQLLDAGGNQITVGSVSGAGATDGELSSIGVYVGTFGGGSFGSWNGTMTATSFYGTWANTSYQNAGSFVGSRVSSLVSGSISGSGNDGSYTGTLAPDAQTLSGDWDSAWTVEEGGITYTGSDSGTWTGAKVDANRDAPEFNGSTSTTSATTYLFNLYQQAFYNIVAKLVAIVDTDDNFVLDVPSEILNRTLTTVDVTSLPSGISAASITYDSTTEEVYEFSITFDDPGYTEAQTGLTFTNGTFAYAYDLASTATVDSDSIIGNGTDDNGLTVTYQDATTTDLYIEATLDYNTATITGPYELGGTDYKNEVAPFWF